MKKGDSNRTEYRMYFFVPSNLSSLQQGIQTGQSVVEYAYRYGNEDDFRSFAFWDKTFIVLDGGTANTGYCGHELGTIDMYHKLLTENNIQHSIYVNSDLNEAITGICVLVEDKVWNYEKYPEFREYLLNAYKDNIIEHMRIQRNNDEQNIKEYNEHYTHWIKSIGGEKNLFLRNFLRNKKPI